MAIVDPLIKSPVEIPTEQCKPTKPAFVAAAKVALTTPVLPPVNEIIFRNVVFTLESLEAKFVDGVNIVVAIYTQICALKTSAELEAKISVPAAIQVPLKLIDAVRLTLADPVM